jgi:hypothetical protein
MQVIVENRKTTNTHGKNVGEFLQPDFDPSLPIVRPLAQQECLAYATRHAVIPASDRRVYKMSTCHRHERISTVDGQMLRTAFAYVKSSISRSPTLIHTTVL